MHSRSTHQPHRAAGGLHSIPENGKNPSILRDWVVCLIVPFLVGLRSLSLGQDTNWDQDNYHFYNGFAFWHGKLAIDLAPSGMQTYFNPLLDAFNYVLYQGLPAPVVGFILGFIHGCCFIPIFIIARQLCRGDSRRVQLTLAIGGLLTANFLSGIGNVMGDNATALIGLSGIALYLWSRGSASTRHGNAILWTALAGVIVGLSAGLKLTNAVYCIAFITAVGVSRLSIRHFLAAGIGIVVGVLIGGGYWFAVMYLKFGNPVFPQFGNLFPNRLAVKRAIVDTGWWPKNIHDVVLWPFIFTSNPMRVGQVIVREALWPISYVLVLLWAAWYAIERFAKLGRALLPLSEQDRFVVCFIVVGYVVWMKVFSIARYVVPMEVLLPLLIFILLRACFELRIAKVIAVTLTSISACVAILGGAHSWGHAGWKTHAFRLNAPVIENPRHATVIIDGSTDAHGWLAGMFPDTVAFAQVNGNFPASDAFRRAVVDMVKQRGGPAYAILSVDDAAHVGATQTLANALFLNIGLPDIKRCTPYTGFIGTKPYPFQWCELASGAGSK